MCGTSLSGIYSNAFLMQPTPAQLTRASTLRRASVIKSIAKRKAASRKGKKRRGFAKRLTLQLVQSPKVLKERLDLVFSAYIRQRDGRCLEGEMWGGCNGPIQAGHVISRRHLAIRWDERNVFGQCRSHNYQHTFNPNLYIAWYTKTFGADQYAELVRLSRTTFKPTKLWLLDKISYYETKLRDL